MTPTALVTGASRGLGRGVAEALARAGYRVIVTSRDVADAKVLAHALGPEHLALQLDVADRASIAALAALVENHAPALDVLINNAGIALEGFDAGVVRRTLDTNYYGALHVTQALAPRLGRGAVTMVSSGMGELAAYPADLRRRFLDPALTIDALDTLVEEFHAKVAAGTHTKAGWPSSAYRVSKAALNALTRILARELAPTRVNSVCPGWVRTDMGGVGAPRDLATGVASILATALLQHDSGGFYRDGRLIGW